MLNRRDESYYFKKEIYFFCSFYCGREEDGVFGTWWSSLALLLIEVDDEAVILDVVSTQVEKNQCPRQEIHGLNISLSLTPASWSAGHQELASPNSAGTVSGGRADGKLFVSHLELADVVPGLGHQEEASAATGSRTLDAKLLLREATSARGSTCASQTLELAAPCRTSHDLDLLQFERVRDCTTAQHGIV